MFNQFIEVRPNEVAISMTNLTYAGIGLGVLIVLIVIIAIAIKTRKKRFIKTIPTNLKEDI